MRQGLFSPMERFNVVMCRIIQWSVCVTISGGVMLLVGQLRGKADRELQLYRKVLCLPVVGYECYLVGLEYMTFPC